MVPVMDLLAGFLSLVTSFAAVHPVITGIVIVVAALLVLSRTRKGGTQRDPSRLFSSAQRSTGFTRAGQRCEFDLMVLWRCRKPASSPRARRATCQNPRRCPRTGRPHGSAGDADNTSQRGQTATPASGTSSADNHRPST